MKKIIATSILSATLASGFVMANDMDQVTEKSKEIVAQYIQGLCENNIEKMNEVYIHGELRLDDRAKQVGEECRKAGGVSKIEVEIPPWSHQMYESVGSVQVSIAMHLNNNEVYVTSVLLDEGRDLLANDPGSLDNLKFFNPPVF